MLVYGVCNMMRRKKLGVTVLLSDLRSKIDRFWVNLIRKCCHSNGALAIKTAIIWKKICWREWQQKFLSAYLKETPKPYIEVYYRIFMPALFGEIFWLEIFICPPSWIFVAMHDTSQLVSRNFFSYDTMINLLQ